MSAIPAPLPAQRPAVAPPGFAFTGECRLPRKGDWFLGTQITDPKGPHALHATYDWETLGYKKRPQWILRPLLGTIEHGGLAA